MKRALLIVLDSVGCGHAPDAQAYGDSGANTLGHLFEHTHLHLPHLDSLGLASLLGLGPAPSDPRLGFTRMSEASAGKDTTTGHWEIAGCLLDQPFATFTSFPPTLLSAIGGPFLGNKAASGTEILRQLGEEHLRTGHPIIYTSADSVLQIAAHEETYGLQRLQDLCQHARHVLDQQNIPIGRVISRPFLGHSAETFYRTPNRHDFSLTPPPNVLHLLQNHQITTIGVGKIADIFAHSGIDASHPSRSNAHGMEIIDHLWSHPLPTPHFIFANLVDFDSLYGHRRDPQGYARCLQDFDHWLGSLLPQIGPDDLLIITADHGNDPYHHGTDHTREQVPLLTVNAPAPVVDSDDFTQVARLVAAHFGI